MIVKDLAGGPGGPDLDCQLMELDYGHGLPQRSSKPRLGSTAIPSAMLLASSSSGTLSVVTLVTELYCLNWVLPSIMHSIANHVKDVVDVHTTTVAITAKERPRFCANVRMNHRQAIRNAQSAVGLP